ncbi:hypothetical protein ACMA1D_21805, partial [Streptomyces sp. 796.1]
PDPRAPDPRAAGSAAADPHAGETAVADAVGVVGRAAKPGEPAAARPATPRRIGDEEETIEVELPVPPVESRTS